MSVAWARGQIAELAPTPTGGALALNRLFESLHAVRRGYGQVFGMNLGRFSVDDRAVLQTELIAALVAWKDWLESRNDLASMLGFDRNVKALAGDGSAPFGRAIDELRVRLPQRRAFGERHALSPAWRDRVEALDAIIRGERSVAVEALGVVGASDGDELRVSFGARDDGAMERYVAGIEAGRVKLPLELEAWWSTANGISIDDDPFLESIEQWHDYDHGELAGVCIGCGHYFQGSLVLAGDLRGQFDHVQVVDVDDDGIEHARYASFAAFVDVLIGR